MGNEKSRYIEVMGSAEKWLWASLVFGAGSKYIREIIYRYESIDEAYEKLALSSVNEAEEEITINSPIDIVELSLKDAWSSLGEIIGETYTEELLDELFSRFCLGK